MQTILRTFFRRSVLASGIALVVVVGSVAVVDWQFERKVEGIDRVGVEGLSESEGVAANFLLIGSDSRDFVESTEQQEAFGTESDAGGRRSDTLMILHVDPKARQGFLVSFPRDLWVEIPGVGGSKINAAFNYGPTKVIETIESNFGVPIQHYLEVNFAGFEGVVEAVGGVSVYFPAPARDELTGLDVAAGCITLDGPTALAYVRSRHFEQLEDGEWEADPSGDIGRIDRQQTFMRRLASEAVTTALANPLRANEIADEALAELTADSELDPGDVKGILNAFRTVDPNDPSSIEMITIPWKTGPSQGGQSVLYLDQPAADQVLARLRRFDGGQEELPAVPPSQISVQVLNGTEISGLAGGTLDALVAQGFVSAGKGDAPEKGIARTAVRYGLDDEAKARVVLGYLGGVGVLEADEALADVDVQVVLGTDFTGVTAPGVPAPTTTAPAPPPSEEPAATAPPVPEC